MTIRKRPLLSKVLLGVLVVATASVFYTNIFPKERVTHGKQADFTLNTVQGAEVNLASLKGKGIIVSFWATYCPPCEKELPYLDQAYKKYKQQGVEIIGVNVAEPRIIVNKFLQQRNIEFPIALDWNGDVAEQYNVLALPTTVVIDANGEVIDEIVGELTEQKIEQIIQSIKP